MVKDIIKDEEFLKRQSINFDKKAHQQIVQDLMDTAKAHQEDCVGLAAVQIGYLVRAFVVKNIKTGKFQVFTNPFIVKKSPQTYEAEEGCLSLDGTRKVRRYTWVDVVYTDANGKYHKEVLEGLKAEVFQHEYDHTLGKLI